MEEQNCSQISRRAVPHPSRGLTPQCGQNGQDPLRFPLPRQYNQSQDVCWFMWGWFPLTAPVCALCCCWDSIHAAPSSPCFWELLFLQGELLPGWVLDRSISLCGSGCPSHAVFPFPALPGLCSVGLIWAVSPQIPA